MLASRALISLFAAFVGLLTVVFLYWPGLSGGYFFDDSANILESSELQIKELSIDSLGRVVESGKAGPLKRPVSMLSFAFNYYFSGFDPFPLKLTNLAIHCANALLVFGLFCLFLRVNKAGDGRRSETMVAAGLALLWAIHPIQLTSVLYVVQRMTSLSSMFELMALMLHIWARQRGRFGRTELACLALSWGLLFPLAVLSKETGLLFVLYVFAYESTLQKTLNGRFDFFGRWYAIAVVCGAVAAALYTFSPFSGLLASYETRPFSLGERLLTETRIIWEYLYLIVLPDLSNFGLYHDDFALSKGLLHPVSTIFAVAGLGFLGCVGWAIRKNQPIIAFGILWFFLGHALESTIYPLELMHEHRNYLPSIGVIVLLVPAIRYARSVRTEVRTLAATIAVAILFYCGMLTFLRANMYGDNFRRTQVEVQYRPASVRSQYEAGAIMVNSFNENPSPMLAVLARKHFKIANQLDPSFKLALVGELQISCLAEKTAPEDVYSELKKRLAATKWTPQDRTVMRGIAEMSNAATLCLSRSQVDELFKTAFHNATTNTFDRSVMLSDYASYLWLGQKDYLAARDALYRAIADNPDDSLNRLNLLQLLRLLGDAEGVSRMLAELSTMRLKTGEAEFLHKVKQEVSMEMRSAASESKQ